MKSILIKRTDGGISHYQVWQRPVEVEQTVKKPVKRIGVDGSITEEERDVIITTTEMEYPDIQSCITAWEEAHKNIDTGEKTLQCQSWKEIDPSVLPQDRTFREAWAHDCTVDMDKARAIQMERIRKSRDVALKKMDIETMKGNDVQSQKQVLRDIPQTFDLSKASTPEELKALWPDELK